MSWEAEYSEKLRTADEALRFVESRVRVYIQPGCAEPETLVEALMRRGPAVRDVEIVHMMTEKAGTGTHDGTCQGIAVHTTIPDGQCGIVCTSNEQAVEFFHRHEPGWSRTIHMSRKCLHGARSGVASRAFAIGKYREVSAASRPALSSQSRAFPGNRRHPRSSQRDRESSDPRRRQR